MVARRGFRFHWVDFVRQFIDDPSDLLGIWQARLSGSRPALLHFAEFVSEHIDDLAWNRNGGSWRERHAQWSHLTRWMCGPLKADLLEERHKQWTELECAGHVMDSLEVCRRLCDRGA